MLPLKLAQQLLELRVCQGRQRQVVRKRRRQGLRVQKAVGHLLECAGHTRVYRSRCGSASAVLLGFMAASPSGPV